MKLVNIQDVQDVTIKSFFSGDDHLDDFFHKHAKKNDSIGYGRTFVLMEKHTIIGFFTLCTAQIEFEEYPKRLIEKLPRYPIPAIRIARLAVDSYLHGKGYGKTLLREAFLKILTASSVVGSKLIIVDAKESSKPFYEHFGFIPLSKNKLTYFMHIDTLIQAFNNPE